MQVDSKVSPSNQVFGIEKYWDVRDALTVQPSISRKERERVRSRGYDAEKRFCKALGINDAETKLRCRRAGQAAIDQWMVGEDVD